MGERYSVTKNGMCPSNLEEPRGKKIPIAIIGSYPYVVYNDAKEWVGGTEFQVIDLYVRKFGFVPELIRATGYDNDGSVVDLVRNNHPYYHNVFLAILFDRSTEKSVKLE